jgi:nucleotide-binding universal stress UspA family protein
MSHQQEFTEAGVLVGVDGSVPSLAAVEWAARAAADSGQPLILCLVVPDKHTATTFGDPEIGLVLARRAEQVLERARTEALTAQPELRTVTRVVAGQPAEQLAELAAGADMLVVGSHGTGWLHRLIVGSTSMQLAAHAPGTLVVTRTDPYRVDGRVLVGVDDSEPAQAALEFAFATAARLGRWLLAIHAYAVPPSVPTQRLENAQEPALISRLDATRVLDDALAPWTAKYPEMNVRREICRGPASRVLAKASVNAALLVVGSRGHGGFPGLLLGSVSQHVVALATCPVAITH